MTIIEAEKRCEELNERISTIRKDCDFDSWTRYNGRIEIKPLKEELDKLLTAVIKAKETIKIEI